MNRSDSMKRIAQHIFAAGLALCISLPVAAQEFRTSYFMQTSNFRHQMNPALLDNSYTAVMLGNFNVGTTGNIGMSNFIYELEGDPRYDLTTFMSPTVNATDFLNDLNAHNRFDLYLNWNLFSQAFKAFGGVNVVELNLRSNTHLSLPYELFELAKTTGAKQQYELTDIGMQTNNYVELALGHSHKINRKLTVGAKLKFLVGAGYADFSADKLSLTLNGDYWRVQGNAKLQAAILDGGVVKHDLSEPCAPDGRPRFDEIDDFKFAIPGYGGAIDLGATYQLTNDLMLSAAVTDIGFIKWSNMQQASTAGDYTFDGFENIHVEGEETPGTSIDDQMDQLTDDLEDMFAIYDDGKRKATTWLATTVNVGAEYTMPFYRKLRVGALYTGRFNGLYSYHQGMVSAVVRPLKWIEATVNASYGSTGFCYGAALSLKAPHFNFYVGADRILGEVGKQYIPLNNMNTNINIGMTFPL